MNTNEKTKCAMIAIVGIVVLAITNFVTTKAGEIR